MSKPVKQAHVPMRTCIATGEKKPKKELLRLVRLSEQKDLEAKAPARVVIDLTGKLRGRGANITPTVEALEAAFKKQAIERALKLESKLSPAEVEQLKQEMQDAISEREFRQGRKPVKLKVKKEEFEQKVGM
jgi:predicted RNA-binding protein YlxR (DUF448 family)